MSKAKQIFLLISLHSVLAPGVGLAQNAPQALIDSLENVIETTKSDEVKALSLCRLCHNLGRLGSIESAIDAGKTGLKLARETGDLNGEEMCLNEIGVLYHKRGEFARALKYYQEALEIAHNAENQRKVAKALNNIGLIYKQQGAISRALEFFLACSKIYEKLDARRNLGASYVNIGIIYVNQGEYEQALEHYYKSLDIFDEIGELNFKANALNNIGVVHFEQGNIANALECHARSLNIRKKINDRNGVASSLGNMGLAYKQQGDLLKALKYYQDGLEISEETGDQDRIAFSLCNIANLKIETNQPIEARVDAARALALAQEIGALENMRHAALLLSITDSALGDWKSAYEHFKLYKQYSDSLHNEAQSKEIGRLEAQYEFDKEIEERERLEKEAAERRQMLYWIAVGVFAALLLVAGLLTWGYRTKRKANKQLASQNAEIIQQSEEISQQRDELQALNEQITEQRDVLEKAHEEITDSIDYASRIQLALLPGAEEMKKGGEVFVYYKARDVVSGDFYWTHQIDEDTFLYAAVDCTGHGVPGAFMSVLGSTTLDTIVREYGETRPDLMLGLLDQGVRASLKQDEHEAGHKDGALDGMDLALVKLDRKRGVLAFSSAGRPLYLLRNGEIREYKGAKFPGGGAQHGEKTFPLETIPLETGDRFFLFSDGITDQFGGPRGRKFSPRRLKEALLAHRGKSLQAQGAAFAQIFGEWQKNSKQLDDQLLVGLEA